MTSSAATASVLTAIVCVVRASAPAVLALDHIIQLLDEFVNVPVLSSLPKAAASGSVRWFDRVYQRTLGASSLPTPPRIDEDPLIEYTLAKAMKAAVEHTHRAIAQRIHALHPQRLPVRLLPIAAKTGDLAMFQWLLAHRTDDLCTPDCESEACASVQFARIEMLSCCLHRAFIEAIRHEQLHIVKWLLKNGCTQPDSHDKAGDKAASTGDLEMVQWLHTNKIPHSFSKRAIDNAVKNGHVHVVQFLITTRSEGFTTAAVHNAFIGGYDDIHEVLRLSELLPVEEFGRLGKWAQYAVKAGRLDLLESARYAIDDAYQAMLCASQYGHLHVVQWLRKNHRAQPEAWVAAREGHLHILQWMHDQQMCASVNWGTSAMDCAAHNGHLAVVQWLHTNRHEGCTTKAMDYATKTGHFEVVHWLHTNRQEGCSASAMDCG